MIVPIRFGTSEWKDEAQTVRAVNAKRLLVSGADKSPKMTYQDGRILPPAVIGDGRRWERLRGVPGGTQRKRSC